MSLELCFSNHIIDNISKNNPVFPQYNCAYAKVLVQATPKLSVYDNVISFFSLSKDT